jgi:hypothetical protein
MTPTVCAPVYATARTPDRPTLGGRAVNVARALGAPFDPWQRQLVMTAGELTETGTLAYPTVVAIVPRRAGKTLAALCAAAGVLVGGPARRAWYTLHRREIGAALWRDEWFPMLEASGLGGPKATNLLGLRRSNGSESMTVRRLGSTMRLFAPSGEALRSQNADVVIVDEAREFTLEAGATLEAAIRPAQARRPLRQLWVISSAPGPGAAAKWLRRYRDRGRAAVDAGRTEGVLYLEYAAPRDLPWDDPSTWTLGHPGIAAGHIGADALLPDLEAMDPESFQAEYLGWWAAEHDQPGAVDLEAWAEGAGTVELGDLAGWVVAADVTPDRARGAVAVAAPAPGGGVHVELVAEGPGATWVVGAALELLGRRRDARLVVDTYGPAANLGAELAARARGRVLELATAEAARSCATFVDLITDRRVSHRGQPELGAVLAAAVGRRYGESWLWDRRVTDPAVLAATWATGVVAAAPPPVTPMVASSLA